MLSCLQGPTVVIKNQCQVLKKITVGTHLILLWLGVFWEKMVKMYTNFVLLGAFQKRKKKKEKEKERKKIKKKKSNRLTQVHTTFQKFHLRATQQFFFFFNTIFFFVLIVPKFAYTQPHSQTLPTFVTIQLGTLARILKRGITITVQE